MILCSMSVWLYLLLIRILCVSAQNQCYFGPGKENRAFSDLIPCSDSGQSACCLLGSVCLSGNACWDPNTEDTYQYGCTDESYEDPSCPSKCNFNTTLSKWVALEYCGAFAPNTWACHAPESCGKYCPSSVPWNPSLETLTANGCSDMKSDARVALYAPSTIDHILSLPSSVGGSTGYYPPGSTTVVDGYTPSAIQPLTTYVTTVPTTPVLIAPSAGSETLVSTLSVQANSLAASTTASSPTSSSLPTPIPSSGLTTGSKAGIGVGVAGGVVLIAVAIISFLNFRKRRRQRLSQQPPHMQYPQQPPMQGAPYYDPQEKSTWRGTYAPPGVHQPPTAYSEAAAYPPQQKAVPVELSSEQRPTELESMSAVNLDPAPSYSDPRASSENAQRFISRTPMD